MTLGMSSNERKVFLHIGLHKTGTTYLQNMFRDNRDRLLEQGVHFPGGKGQAGQGFAVWDLLGRRPPTGQGDERIAGQWKSLVASVAEADAPTSLISEESLSLATVRQATRAVNAFVGAEVHVIVTVRDLARVLVSAWQEDIKNDKTWSWAEYAAAVRDVKAQAVNPARDFWLRQDLPAILETWQAVLPVERMHVVTVPPPKSSSDLLLERLASVVGFEIDTLDDNIAWSNETIGVAGTEVLRRLNQRLAHGLTERQYVRVVKRGVVRTLAERTDPARFTLPAEDFEWVQERSAAMIAFVRTGGYPVVGDLEELQPRLAEGRRPDDPSDGELLDAALTALAGLSERYATEWWARRRPAEGVPAAPATVKAASNARAVIFRSQRAGVELADRNRVAGKALGWYLRARASARRRAVRR
jgi:hypothetical protein